MSSAVDIGTMIVRTPGTLGGRPRIDGTRIGVDRIAIEVVRHHATAEEIVSEDYWPYLSLAQVHAALAYYFANQAEIDEYNAEHERVYLEHLNATGANGRSHD